MKNNIFLSGTHWGDEGKGKVVDVIAAKMPPLVLGFKAVITQAIHS